jgi:maleylpyruvate isomerase
VEQYDGGPAARAADIEAGAGRPAAELVDDVARSIERLEAAWAAAPPTAWAGHGRNASGALWPCASFPRSRWREIEVHHVDLGLGYEPTDWPPEYVDLELPAAVADLPARLVPEDRARLLGWLLDRSAQPELELAGWQADPDRYHSTL